MKALEAVLQVVREREGEVGVWRTLIDAKATEQRRQVRVAYGSTWDRSSFLCLLRVSRLSYKRLHARPFSYMVTSVHSLRTRTSHH